MFSQGSELFDFRLAREGIITQQRAGRPETSGQKRSPFLACVSMFSQGSEIFDFRLAREVIIA